ncbi:hypothetical protein A9C19_20205 [Bacillus weihaiensis]|uniref:Uncharacterized protein n=1 Tax=Bacillus weihaiensis TaxID=1547283 RepID=A0A1L3MWW0_9BACI|nr:hypothetical protein A9C19_20205 [Bacillus weihaiensis]
MEFIKYQDQVIRTLLTFYIGKSVFEKPDETPVNPPYLKLQVDDFPVIGTTKYTRMVLLLPFLLNE